MSIAFFDLDRTLISRNSGSMWVRAELRAGYVTWLQALEAAMWIARYHFGSGDIGAAIKKAVRTMEGESETEIRDRSRAFYDSEVRTLYRPGARDAVEDHRRRGDRLVLLTTSSNYLSEPVTEDLALDDFLCNRFVIDDAGRFTGAVHEPLCYGAGKVDHAKRYADSCGERLEDASFYSDSSSDIPMLEAVGTPVVVSPDPNLRRAALQRNWPIVDWGN